MDSKWTLIFGETVDFEIATARFWVPESAVVHFLRFSKRQRSRLDHVLTKRELIGIVGIVLGLWAKVLTVGGRLS